MSNELPGGGRRLRKAQRTRESMSQAALELVLRDGLEAVTVESITELVNVSRRSFSRYFGSKEEAVLDGLRADFERINEALGNRPLSEAPVQAYREAVREWLRDETEPAWHRRPGVRALLTLIADEPTLTAVFRRLSVEAEDQSIAVIAKRLGLDPDRDMRPSAAAGIGVAALFTATRAWVHSTDRDLPELAECAFTALFDELHHGQN